MTTKIPYVIYSAKPDYKRPSVDHKFGTVDENLLDTFFVEKAAEFIYYDNCDSDSVDNFKSVEDITKFWETYFCEYYMGNVPWDALIFINGEWKNVTPSDNEIFDYFMKIKNNEKLIDDCEDEDEDEDEDENEDDNKQENEEDFLTKIVLTDEEQEIHNKMMEYMRTEIDKSDFDKMSKMNKVEQTIYVLNKCLLNISSDKYKKNRELFYKFLMTVLRLTEEDISLTTEEMEKNYNEIISLKLDYLMNIYGSLLEYKTIFNYNVNHTNH